MFIKLTKQQALKHYDRMIEWAKTQDPFLGTDRHLMLHSLGEFWYSDDCPYCIATNSNCQLCKLKGAEEISSSCCGGLWEIMARSLTWGEWIENAKKVREYIEENG